MRQGSVLAPALFAVYINDILKAASRNPYGYILAYADDLLIIARSCLGLQILFDIVSKEIESLCLELNISKSCCLRIGNRFNIPCLGIATSNGAYVKHVDRFRYLGVTIVSARNFCCSVDSMKRSFNRAVNSIIGKLGCSSNEDVIVHLIKTNCLPILLYGSEASSLKKAQLLSLDFFVVRFGMKLFHTGSRPLVVEAFENLGLVLPSVTVPERCKKFLTKFVESDNIMCKIICAKFNVDGI